MNQQICDQTVASGIPMEMVRIQVATASVDALDWLASLSGPPIDFNGINLSGSIDDVVCDVMRSRAGVIVRRHRGVTAQFYAVKIPSDTAAKRRDTGLDAYGTTPLEAGLRCLVFSRLGSEAMVPRSLAQQCVSYEPIEANSMRIYADQLRKPSTPEAVQRCVGIDGRFERSGDVVRTLLVDTGRSRLGILCDRASNLGVSLSGAPAEFMQAALMPVWPGVSADSVDWLLCDRFDNTFRCRYGEDAEIDMQPVATPAYVLTRTHGIHCTDHRIATALTWVGLTGRTAPQDDADRAALPADLRLEMVTADLMAHHSGWVGWSTEHVAELEHERICLSRALQQPSAP